MKFCAFSWIRELPCVLVGFRVSWKGFVKFCAFSWIRELPCVFVGFRDFREIPSENPRSVHVGPLVCLLWSALAAVSGPGGVLRLASSLSCVLWMAPEAEGDGFDGEAVAVRRGAGSHWSCRAAGSGTNAFFFRVPETGTDWKVKGKVKESEDT